MSEGAPDSRIAARFADLRQQGRGGLVTFLTAGDPDADTSAALLAALPAAGADVIELGMPFSDPIADGPAIQRASVRALKAGMTLRRTLAMVTGFRQQDQHTPIILMGYYNPILSYGIAGFTADARRAGVDGLIIVDLPPEEDADLRRYAAAAGIDLIRLATPTSDDARLPKVLEGAGGFLYYVAVAGITGTRSASGAAVTDAVTRLRRHTDLPLAVGFGIRTPDQAATVAQVADAAVVGTALVDRLADGLDGQDRAGTGTAESVLGLVRDLAGAVRAARG